MNGCIIAMESMTYAVKGQRIFAKNGIVCSVVRLPGKTNKGCAYGISLGCSEVRTAYRLLQESGVPAGVLLT